MAEDGEENRVEGEGGEEEAPAEETDEDEEVRLAMEMALAAAQNPKMSPAELRKLIGEKNKQAKIVAEVEKKKQEQKQKEKEEAAAKAAAQRQETYNWFSEQVAGGAAAFGKAAADMQTAAERQLYADQIRKDKKMKEIRRAIKAKTKSLKAYKLQGNRVETRHTFKRQRLEKYFIDTNTKIEKLRRNFLEGNYAAQEYAKAMMKASKKWEKKVNDEELALESQLCRNMHQMLALEKQKSKLKKTLKEIKKYLQRCKSWLTDKQALCELHMLTLDATSNSLEILYEDTLKSQDAKIKKMLALEEFKDVDVDGPSRYDEIPNTAGPGATLNALRGLPFRDSIRMKKESESDGGSQNDKAPEDKKVTIENIPTTTPASQRELVVQTDGNASVNSALTDPDENNPGGFVPSVMSAESADFAFAEDAPWGDKEAAPAAGDGDAENGQKKIPQKPNNNIAKAKSVEEKPKGEGGNRKPPPVVSDRKPPPPVISNGDEGDDDDSSD